MSKRDHIFETGLNEPLTSLRGLVKSDLYMFIRYFWSEYSSEEFKGNWHIEYICNELQIVADHVINRKPKLYDLIINVPPGTSKTSTILIMFPLWVWINAYDIRFITASYTSALSLESAEYSRDVVRSEKFQQLFPEIAVKEDKDTKSNFRVIRKEYKNGKLNHVNGGNRFSTSVGGTLTGFHGHMLLVDDPLDPNRAVSRTELEKANRWVSETLSTRKVDKEVTPMILVMQRLHENDPTGYLLKTKKNRVKHISMPAEINNYKHRVKPAELTSKYINNLLDPVRMPMNVLSDLEEDLGQYGYSGQIGQDPTPPGGGMFHVENFSLIEHMVSPVRTEKTVRYWDKAGTSNKKNPKSANTCGVKMVKTREGKFIVVDVKKGQWGTDERERIIRQTAEADGEEVEVYVEQEPGSGGKESAESTIRNLSGFSIFADRPQGDKIYRADPFSVQVNNGNVMLLKGEWNTEYIQELRYFPFGTLKDQVDASSGAFAKLSQKRRVKVL